MSIEIVARSCPTCSNKVEVETKYLGQKILCPHCRGFFVPAYSHSGYGIASCLLGILSIAIEVAVLAYFIVKPSWGTEFLSPEHMGLLVRCAGILGILISWFGIVCAITALAQQKRRFKFVMWGLLLNLLPNLVFAAYFAFKPPWVQKYFQTAVVRCPLPVVSGQSSVALGKIPSTEYEVPSKKE